jgi:hypothetical protein
LPAASITNGIAAGNHRYPSIEAIEVAYPASHGHYPSASQRRVIQTAATTEIAAEAHTRKTAFVSTSTF